MVVTFEDPCYEDLEIVVSLLLKVELGGIGDEEELTMPKANTAPRPRTIPYPQPTFKGGAIGILSCSQAFLVYTIQLCNSRKCNCFLETEL